MQLARRGDALEEQTERDERKSIIGRTLRESGKLQGARTAAAPMRRAGRGANR